MKAKMTAHLHAQRSYDGSISFTVASCDLGNCGYTKIMEKEIDIEFDVPENFDLTEKEIAALKEQKKRVQAEAQREITRIEEMIQSLQAIEYKDA